ncbi:MAG: phosphoribosylanthranilate isomerase [Candidatus Methanoplasma sp.]|jgi:phosphoribosylanthranilate isomerase|nr:phosphoribosylanthranilate isomerase [Candidatus Methanoplasma sp.]
MTHVKICGLTTVADAGCVNDNGAEYAGFVFAEGSRRTVTPETASDMRRTIGGDTVTVGVFADQSADLILRLVRDGTIGAVQLHGREDRGFIGMIRAEAGVQVIKSFSITDEGDIADAAASDADMIMLDSGGGTGKRFDWSLVKDIGRPFFLAGGLDPENVREAVKYIRPFAVDVSSGVETDGRKDPSKIREFIRTVRQADGEDRT